MNAPIISRAEAKARGLKRYFTGKPCKWGHVAERTVCDKTCIKCSMSRTKERHRKRYRENPEPKRARVRAFRLKNLKRERYRLKKRRDKISDLIAVLREENPEMLKEFGL